MNNLIQRHWISEVRNRRETDPVIFMLSGDLCQYRLAGQPRHGCFTDLLIRILEGYFLQFRLIRQLLNRGQTNLWILVM